MGDWFKMWYDDKKSILETMNRNMYDDIDNGYDINGQNIKHQQKQINEYSIDINRNLSRFQSMTDKQIDQWCKIDLIRRGVIEI